MRVPVLASFRALIVSGGIGFVVAIPMACAQGSTDLGIGGPGGPIGVGGAGGSRGFGGVGGAGGMPANTSTSTDTSSGFPNASSTTSTGFPTASSSTGFPVSSSSTGFPTSSSTGFPTASSTGPTTTVSSSSGGPSSPCDTGGTSQTACDNCSTCAQSSVCQSQVFDCELDCDCSNILACIQAMGCTDSNCVQTCINSDPFGEQLFDAMLQCLDCACVQTCGVPPGTCP